METDKLIAYLQEKRADYKLIQLEKSKKVMYDLSKKIKIKIDRKLIIKKIFDI